MNAKATMDPKTIDETENAGPRIDYGSVAPGAMVTTAPCDFDLRIC